MERTRAVLPTCDPGGGEDDEMKGRRAVLVEMAGALSMAVAADRALAGAPSFDGFTCRVR
jgi:hypothetical protein